MLCAGVVRSCGFTGAFDREVPDPCVRCCDWPAAPRDRPEPLLRRRDRQRGVPGEPAANPHNDARAVYRRFARGGFKAKRIEDATRADSKLLVEGLPKSLPEGAVVTPPCGPRDPAIRARTIPCRSTSTSTGRRTCLRTSLELSDARGELQEAQVGMAIVVLDACRDYPFGPLADAFGHGLANVATSGENLVASPRRQARWLRMGTCPKSRYTSALITALELLGRDIDHVFRTV